MSEDGRRAPAETRGPGKARPPRRRRLRLRSLRPRLPRLRGRAWDVIGAVALGGAIGAAARFGVEVAWPTRAESFPWATFTINIAGCALIGILMVFALEIGPAHRLVRPFAGTGLLGGFTTFSAYAVEIEHLVSVGAARLALLYLIATPAAAVAAVWLTTVATRGVLRRRTAR